VTRMSSLKPIFVDHIPEQLADGTLYIAIQFGSILHRCCCGCGFEVVTPLSPTQWRMIYDGQTVSLEPSIGNWNFPCRSHYWIRRNQIQWARAWSQQEINAVQAGERAEMEVYYAGRPPLRGDGDVDSSTAPPRRTSWWARLKGRLTASF
jgi:hypothetical protein